MTRTLAAIAGGAIAAAALYGAYRLVRWLYEDPDTEFRW